MKSLNVRHIPHHLVSVLSEVEGGELVEVHRRGRPVARIVPVPAGPSHSDWTCAEERLLEAYPTPSGGTTAAQAIAEGRGER